MTHLRRGDADLHYEDGTHKSTPPTADGHQLELYERRITRHLAEHAGEQPSDRLAKVTPRSTYIIECWYVPFEAEHEGASNWLIGPFTEREAREVARTLTCAHAVTPIRTQPPDWATGAWH